MATPLFRCQVALHRDQGLPEDDIVNTLHFEGDDDDFGTDQERWDTLLPGLVARVKTFYTTVATLTLSNLLSNTATLKVYNMRDPSLPNAPRFPRHTEDFTITPQTGLSLPAEVAICLSFRGASESGTNRRRRTGRVYLGPIRGAVAVSVEPFINDVRPDPSVMAFVLTAAETMALGGEDLGAGRLAVYSPTTDLTNEMTDESWNDVTELWIDNSFDTIRKRGAAPTSRITAAV